MSSTTSVDLAAVLGHWADGSGPLYLQLAEAIQRAIERGELVPGTRLPPERNLARDLAVSRTTVIGAFDELKTAGWLESRQGSGTWVARRTRDLDVRVPEDQPLASFVISHVLRGASPANDLLDLATTAFAEPTAIRDALVRVADSELARMGFRTGYLPHGLAELRAAVADYFTSRSVPTTPSQVLITSGVQQAAALIGHLFLPDGGPVMIENPTWTGLLDVLRSLGCHLVPVPVDGAGARIDVVRETLARSRPRLIWLTPAFHNPTGALLSEDRVRAAGRLAAEYQIPLVENRALELLHLERPPGPAIAQHSPDHIITVGSLSKVFWPGLRVGWIRASETTIARLARLKSVWDNGCGAVDQLVAVELLAEVDTHAALRRAHAVAALEQYETARREHLPEWTWTTPAGGLSLWARIPRGSAFELSQVALRHGVEFVPGAVFSPSETFRSHLRLPLTLPLTVIPDAVRRLAAAWSSYDERGSLRVTPRHGVGG